MIRTRNFLLYVLALVFFVSSSGYMLVSDIADTRQSASAELARAAEPDGAEVSVVASTEPTDRAGYIARMKERLARGEGKLTNAPVVLTSVDARVTESVPDGTDGRAVAWCEPRLSIETLTLDWSPDEMAIRETEGARLVLHASEERTVLQLPIRHAAAASPSCLPYEMVGISVDGGLIHNSDAVRYQSAGAETLVGYALDGFPIHGPVADTAALDACGGMTTPTGYRYHIRPNEPFILACFAAPPARFIE